MADTIHASQIYFRPVDLLRGERAERALHLGDALPLAGGPLAFQSIEILSRVEPPRVVRAIDIADRLEVLTGQRERVADLPYGEPAIMGILNVTPDSFSDGGELESDEALLARSRAMIDAGADILDIGGESTRPGSDLVGVEEELSRVIPAITTLSAEVDVPLSIDSRKPEVFAPACQAGATLINDVSALTHSDGSLDAALSSGNPIILMHAQGDPKTMQDDPNYDHVLLDVYDWLAARIDACVAAGLPRKKLIVDPGIGFGKTLEHNLRLLGGLSLFHGLGVPVLLGTSRKSFIHKMTGAPDAKSRLGGSLASAVWGASQGVQIVRVHDVFETAQAIAIDAGLGRYS